jgi:branched-chain amino acid transport system ATP-binding protein
MSVELRLDRVTAGYGRHVVLRDVDLVVPAGATVALLGANGAGKSTLLRTAAGLLRPFNGKICLGDRRIEHLPEHARMELGLSFLTEVNQGIFRQLTVRENLAMFARGKNVADAIDRAVSAFPILKERLSQEAGSMSGGQQQMVSVCRALIADAPVILADELSLGLAPVVVDEIYEVVARFRAEGRSLLLVEQYVARALALADYVCILHKGRVAFVGEPEQCRDQHIFEQYVGSVA